MHAEPHIISCAFQVFVRVKSNMKKNKKRGGHAHDDRENSNGASSSVYVQEEILLLIKLLATWHTNRLRVETNVIEIRLLAAENCSVAHQSIDDVFVNYWDH